MFSIICNNCGESIPFGMQKCNRCSFDLAIRPTKSSITITDYDVKDASELIYSISYLTGIDQSKITYGLQSTPYTIAKNLTFDELNRYINELSDLNAEFEIYCESNPQQQKPEQKHKHTIHCPNCGSTNVKKISTTKRLFSAELFGLASSSIGKQFQCMEKNCGYKW